jgi:hypothetical protein
VLILLGVPAYVFTRWRAHASDRRSGDAGAPQA